MKTFKATTNSRRNKISIVQPIKNYAMIKFSNPFSYSCVRKTRNTYLPLSCFFFQPTLLINILGGIKKNYRSNLNLIIQMYNFIGIIPATVPLLALPKTSILTTLSEFFLTTYNFQRRIVISNLSYLHLTSKFIRAAGVFGVFLKKKNHCSVIKLPSNQIKTFSKPLIMLVGRNANVNHDLEKLGKAGAKKFFGLKPVVRGTAKNARDHPHGGRTRGGRPKTSP